MTTSSLSDYQPVFFYSEQDLREAIEFCQRWRRRGSAPSTADRVTTILHPFYEAYLLKLFSHSHLLLYTEDLVVLKSELIRSRGGLEPGDRLFLRVPHG